MIEGFKPWYADVYEVRISADFRNERFPIRISFFGRRKDSGEQGTRLDISNGVHHALVYREAKDYAERLIDMINRDESVGHGCILDDKVEEYACS